MMISEGLNSKMKLIFLHGPPAAGKFTVAKELAKITKFKLVHIHDFYDPLAEMFNEDNYYQIIEILNKNFLNLFEGASKLKLKGIVFTYSEIAQDNYKFPRAVIKLMRKQKGTIHFVSISCNEKELYKRVIRPSRQKGYKTKKKSEMDWMLKNKDYSKRVPGVKTLEIDNTKLSSKKVAQQIKKHFKLK